MPPLRRLVFCLLAFVGGAVLALGETRAEGEPAVHVRDGLPHLAGRATAENGELRVGYLGGSITAAEGWRSRTTAHLRARFPRLTLVEIAAGMPGTGSDLGVARLGRDVLTQQPDLLFVEFAVNDTATPPAQIERTMEGIVRQTWRARPRADICFVYTVSTPGLPDLQAGRFPPAARAMENVAHHYGIPTIHLGLDVAQRVTAGTLTFKAATAADNVFSLDGVHPTPAGHRLYFETIRRALPELLSAAPATGPRVLPPPLHADNWEQARIELLTPAMRHGEWATVASDDPNLRGVTKALLPPTWRATKPGDAIEFTFTGRAFGILGIGAPDGGEFRVTVDGQPAVTDTLFDHYASPTFCRLRQWFYPRTLAEGPHRVRIELTGTVLDKAAIKTKAGKTLDDPAPYAAHTLTVSGLLLVGTLAP